MPFSHAFCCAARVVVLPPEHWVLVFCFLDILGILIASHHLHNQIFLRLPCVLICERVALGKVAQVSASWNELASLPTVWRPQLVRHYSPLALSVCPHVLYNLAEFPNIFRFFESSSYPERKRRILCCCFSFLLILLMIDCSKERLQRGIPKI